MKIVPTLASSTPCPITGILHLPRMYTKGTVDEIADGYPRMGGGFDTMVCNHFGVAPEEATAFLETKPTYAKFVEWFKEKSGDKLNGASVQTWNDTAAGYKHDDATRTSILTAAGLPEDTQILTAGELNVLDDLTGFHAEHTGAAASAPS